GRLILDRMAADQVGMIQWVRLLNVTPAPRYAATDKDQYAFDKYARVLELLRDSRDAARVAPEMRDLARDLAQLLDDNVNIPPENLRYFRCEAVAAPAVRFLDKDDDPEAAATLLDLPASLRGRAVGYFRVRLAPEAGAGPEAPEGFAGYARVPDLGSSYY